MAVPITKRILPMDRAHGRTGRKLVAPRTVTIHNTANERAGADAEAHARYLESGHAISWHFTVDADSAVQHIPTDEQAWHTGTNAGNTTSLGIEICEYPQTAAGKALQAKATDNGAWLAAKLLHDNKLGIDKLRTHKSWSGKECPRDILPHWADFKARVSYYLKQMTAPAPATPVAPAWKGKLIKNTFWQRSFKDARVVTWQKRMNALGYALKVDGRFGPKSELALKVFQKKHKLTVDGILGPISWAKAWKVRS